MLYITLYNHTRLLSVDNPEKLTYGRRFWSRWLLDQREEDERDGAFGICHHEFPNHPFKHSPGSGPDTVVIGVRLCMTIARFSCG